MSSSVSTGNGEPTNLRTVSRSILTGAFVNADPLYLQCTGFVLDPQGTVVVSVYSSGAIGRLVPEDVTGLVRYLRQREAASRSRGWLVTASRPAPVTPAGTPPITCLRLPG